MANYQFIKQLREYLGDFDVLNGWYTSDHTHSTKTLNIILNKLRTLRKSLKGLKKQVSKETQEEYTTLMTNVLNLIKTIETQLYSVEFEEFKASLYSAEAFIIDINNSPYTELLDKLHMIEVRKDTLVYDYEQLQMLNINTASIEEKYASVLDSLDYYLNEIRITY